MNGVKYTLTDVQAMPEGEWRIVVLNRLDDAVEYGGRLRKLERIAYTAIGMALIIGGVVGWALVAFVEHISAHPLP